MKTKHSRKDETNARDDADRWREVSARPSIAAQNESKNFLKDSSDKDKRI
jgi:hypothetical protein